MIFPFPYRELIVNTHSRLKNKYQTRSPVYRRLICLQTSFTSMLLRPARSAISCASSRVYTSLPNVFLLQRNSSIKHTDTVKSHTQLWIHRCHDPEVAFESDIDPCLLCFDPSQSFGDFLHSHHTAAIE